MKQKMLICGADGFIGKTALDYFKDRYDITATLFNKDVPQRGVVEGVEYVSIDLRVESEVIDLFESKRFDVVLQAAATTTGAKDVVERPYVHVTDNSVMNSWIFREAMRTKVGHLLFPSCTVMYQPKDHPQSEADWSPLDEIYPAYFGVGNMKVFCEKMCDFYSRIGETKFTAFRHSNVYGPYDKFDLDKCHVVPAFVNKVINADEVLEIWGQGRASRDIIYIDDLIDFIDKCIENQESKYELYNCGAGQAYPILELAKTIMTLNGKDLEFKFDLTKPDIPTTVILNCDKAKNDLGWEPKTSVEEGLKRTSEWYINNVR
jgi:nucleoside-diphosphate-sugar epimerase|tara:strand:- start:1277 stop:2233 length:957 start_codon:yes stop_codon:yes gene_type:complete